MDEFTRLFARIAPSINMEQLGRIHQQPLTGVRLHVPCGDRKVETYIHRAECAGAPILFEMHGGGFALGDAAKNDALRHRLCKSGRIHVVGVNYRKTPRYPYPAALEDVLQVIGWFWEHADSLGLDRNAFFVSGESAGANLATVAATQLNKDGQITIRGQILHYPFLDLTEGRIPQYPTDLAEEVVRAFIELYCDESIRCEATVSPVCTTTGDLVGTAPALIITAGRDTLKSSAHFYADLLGRAGIAVSEIEMDRAHHGYIEDWFNPACYGLVLAKEKIHHSPDFGELAERAVSETIAFIDRCMKQNKY